MRLANLLSGVAFRTTLIQLVVFALVLTIAGAAILRVTQDFMISQLRSGIEEDVDLVHDAEMTGGPSELVNFVRNSAQTRSDKQFAIGLFSLDGKPLAGNVDALPPFFGFGSFDPNSQDDVDAAFLGYVEQLDNSYVVVAHSERLMAAISDKILNALILAGVIICCSALLVGYALTHSVSRKLAVIDRTLDQVSRGDATARLPVSRGNDQIDAVSRRINEHLDRLSEFMAGMRNTIVAIAHDLKSPLNRTYLTLQDAAQSLEPGKALDALEQAQHEVETLDGILETVLRISRIEASDDTSGFAAFSLRELMADLATTFQPVAEGAGQSLRWAETGDKGLVSGDRKMVAQLLVNLIENASRHGGPGVAISLTMQRRHGEVVAIVADNGPGIPRERMEEVFLPFRRLNAARDAVGTGLGLALVKAIAARHRAHVSLFDNAPGLRVEVAFPAAERPADRLPDTGAATPAERTEAAETV